MSGPGAGWRASTMTMDAKAWAELNPRGSALDIVKVEDRVIAVVWSESEDGDDAETARKIAAAVNSHAALVSALERMLRRSEAQANVLAAHGLGKPSFNADLDVIDSTADAPEQARAALRAEGRG